MNEQFEGNWKAQIDNCDYSLYLPGPNTGNGCYNLGDHFNLSQSKTHEDGSGIGTHIHGTFTSEGNHLHLNCKTILIEGWGPPDEEEIDEEPPLQDYEGDDKDGELDLSGDEPVIRMKAFDAEIEFRKVK